MLGHAFLSVTLRRKAFIELTQKKRVLFDSGCYFVFVVLKAEISRNF